MIKAQKSDPRENPGGRLNLINDPWIYSDSANISRIVDGIVNIVCQTLQKSITVINCRRPTNGRRVGRQKDLIHGQNRSVGDAECSSVGADVERRVADAHAV